MPASRIPLVVLARDPFGAKSRLAAELDAAMRARLAIAMLEDVLAAAHEVASVQTFVATDAQAVREVARRAGAIVIDTPAPGTNAAAARAFRWADDSGHRSAAVIAADLPLLAPADVVALVARAAEDPVVIAPDRHGSGTNALLLTPPLAIAPAFGHESFREHLERATRAGLRHGEVRARGLGHDVDEADDLRVIAGDASLGAATRELLRTARSSGSAVSR